MLVARGYNFACVKRRSDCTTVLTLLSMIVGLIHLCESKINGFTLVQEAGNSCCPSQVSKSSQLRGYGVAILVLDASVVALGQFLP